MVPYKYIEDNELIHNYGFVYMTVNTAINRAYIGKKFGTLASKTSYLGSSPKLNADIKIYGKACIKRYILVEGFFTKQFLNELEKHYIQLYGATKSDSFYNESSGSSTDWLEAKKASTISQSMSISKLSKDFNTTKSYSRIADCVKDSKSCAATIVRYAKTGKWNVKDGCYFRITSYRENKAFHNYYESTCTVSTLNKEVKLDFSSVHACANHFETSAVNIVRCFKMKRKLHGKYFIDIHEVAAERQVSKLKNGKRSVVLYNSVEELYFESCIKAADFLVSHYNLSSKSNLAAMLASKLRQINPRYKDFFIKES